MAGRQSFHLLVQHPNACNKDPAESQGLRSGLHEGGRDVGHHQVPPTVSIGRKVESEVGLGFDLSFFHGMWTSHVVF